MWSLRFGEGLGEEELGRGGLRLEASNVETGMGRRDGDGTQEGDQQ